MDANRTRARLRSTNACEPFESIEVRGRVADLADGNASRASDPRSCKTKGSGGDASEPPTLDGEGQPQTRPTPGSDFLLADVSTGAPHEVAILGSFWRGTDEEMSSPIVTSHALEAPDENSEGAPKARMTTLRPPSFVDERTGSARARGPIKDQEISACNAPSLAHARAIPVTDGVAVNASGAELAPHAPWRTSPNGASEALRSDVLGIAALQVASGASHAAAQGATGAIAEFDSPSLEGPSRLPASAASAALDGGRTVASGNVQVVIHSDADERMSINMSVRGETASIEIVATHRSAHTLDVEQAALETRVARAIGMDVQISIASIDQGQSHLENEKSHGSSGGSLGDSSGAPSHGRDDRHGASPREMGRGANVAVQGKSSRHDPDAGGRGRLL